MAQTGLLQIPTALNASTAWDEYCALAHQYTVNDELKVDLEFCKAMARAYKRWSDLFLCLEAA